MVKKNLCKALKTITKFGQRRCTFTLGCQWSPPRIPVRSTGSYRDPGSQQYHDPYGDFRQHHGRGSCIPTWFTWSHQPLEKEMMNRTWKLYEIIIFRVHSLNFGRCMSEYHVSSWTQYNSSESFHNRYGITILVMIWEISWQWLSYKRLRSFLYALETLNRKVSWERNMVVWGR